MLNVLPPQWLVEWLLSPSSLLTVVAVVVGLSICIIAVRNLVKRRNAVHAGSGHARSGRRRIRIEDIASNWQLILLALTAFLLSVASGYRVWEGMTNFTNEKYLSLMITFGLQGIMLIVAWLIGESFANGMSHRAPETRRSTVADTLIGMLLAVVVVAALFYWLLYATGTFGIGKTGFTGAFDWARFADISVYFAIGLIVIAVLAFNFARGGELALPYVQSLRIIVKNSMLWVMFLACMAAAVFFSFDSLFASIFPREERARAAQLRAQNQVAGMVADIGTTIESRRVGEIGHLFGTKDNGWARYDDHLTRLAQVSQGAQREIESYFNAQLEDRNRAIKQQQERISSAQSGSAGLVSKKTTLTDELSRLKAERPSLAGDYTEKKNELDNRARGVDAKRVEAQAEERGAEGTLKQGRGPMYRQIMADLARLQDAYKIQESRVRDSQQRLNAVDSRVAALERELAAVDGDIAKLRGEAETAQQRIRLAQENAGEDSQARIDPSRVLPAFERSRLEFRQEATREKLAALQQQCTQLFTAMAGTPATKDRVRNIDCDPKQAVEASAIMFALNDGLATFEKSCSGGDKLEALKSTDELYGFARRCLADSGLPAKETDELRGRINYLELTRDDKAHPFVASLNAFQDGNRLAYLALGIAIIMESLVFMAGLFGATAVRSPLSDVPSSKARSGKQLEAIVENALLPDTFETARTVLNAMRPITPRDGFSASVTLDPMDPHAPDVRRVLNAAATIGAVRHVDGYDERYEVRAELFEFLSVVAKKAFEADADNARLAELRKVVTVALQPHVGDHADIVIQHARPITEQHGFSAEICLGRMHGETGEDHSARMPADDAFIVRKVLNAGATLNYVQLHDKGDRDGHYFVHKQLYKTLLLIASAAHRTGQRSRAPGLPAPDRQPAAIGGSLDAHQQQVPPPVQHPALPDFSSEPPARRDTPRPAVASLQTHPDLCQYFIDRMVEALGVDPAHYAGIGGETWSAAQAASDAFKLLQRTNRRLDQIIEAREGDAQKTVDRMHERLKSSPEAQAPLGNSALDSAFQDVLNNLSIIALLPGGPLERELRSLRVRLEKQFESDLARPSPEEEHLLTLVRRLEDSIARNARASVEDWRLVHAGFQGPFAVFSNRGQRPSTG